METRAARRGRFRGAESALIAPAAGHFIATPSTRHGRPASPGFRRKLGDAVRLIDATGLHLAGVGAQWARFSTQVCGAKAHVVLDPDHVVFDPDLGRPVYHALSAANVNDISAAKDMPIEAGATYVFDLGYYDFAWWARLDAQGCRLVTRFKKNTPLARARALPLDPRAGVVADRIGFLPDRLAGNRKNPMADAVREIVVTTQTGLEPGLDPAIQAVVKGPKARRWGGPPPVESPHGWPGQSPDQVRGRP